MESSNTFVHVLVAPYEWKDYSQYRRNHLAEYLLQHSATQKVIWVCPGSTAMKIKTGELSNGMLEVAAPKIIPWKFRHISYFYRPLHSQLTSYLSKLLMKYPSAKKILWFTHPNFPGLVDIKEWNNIVYDCSDNWGMPSTNRPFLETIINNFYSSILQPAEDYVLKNSRSIFATSDFLQKKAVSKTSSPVFLVENGVDFDKFYHALPSHNLEAMPGPRLGYVGSMQDRMDFAMLREIAVNHRDWSLVLIGPVLLHYPTPEYLRLLAKEENVLWIPGVNPDEVPAYMKELDIGLMPYRELEFNKAVFSLKFFEYLACGLPVVGCGLPSTEKYASDGIYIHTASDPAKFAAACEKAISWAGDKETILSRINLAKAADWRTKFDYILETVLGTDIQRS